MDDFQVAKFGHQIYLKDADGKVWKLKGLTEFEIEVWVLEGAEETTEAPVTKFYPVGPPLVNVAKSPDVKIVDLDVSKLPIQFEKMADEEEAEKPKKRKAGVKKETKKKPKLEEEEWQAPELGSPPTLVRQVAISPIVVDDE